MRHSRDNQDMSVSVSVYLRTLAVIPVLAVLASCIGESSGGNTCDNCLGCCQQGQCLPGTSPQACGAGGQACSLCGPGVACTNGKCSAAGPPCACPGGCCDVANTCQSGLADTACGVGGQPCRDCLVQGQRCNLSTRSCEVGSVASCSACGPTSCCNSGVCAPGDADDACGSGGQTACVNCLANNQLCDTVDRFCTGCASCDGGCCVGTQCLSGAENHACGTGGATCEDCAGQGLKCDPTTRGCVPMCKDCPTGCCFGPSCVAGTGDSACGKNSEQCEDCAAYGETCLLGSRTCSGDRGCPNCFTGCCEGSTCRAGTGVDACGKEADPCVNCLKQNPGDICHPTKRTCGPVQSP